uniref:Protein argonaute N-terminal domain-containing protein n=1 Tax=Romanomermis culicivorax TaxID=13658 RepID=A0A915JRZ8_ROMCU
MAYRGRGRGLKPQNTCTPGGNRSPISRSDPIGEGSVVNPSQLVDLPEKPALGRIGKPIALITNHFEMKMTKNVILYRYQITIEQSFGKGKITWTNGKGKGLPRNEIRNLCYAVYEEWAKKCRLNVFEMIYDRQRNLYTLNDLQDLGYDGYNLGPVSPQNFVLR